MFFSWNVESRSLGDENKTKTKSSTICVVELMGEKVLFSAGHFNRTNKQRQQMYSEMMGLPDENGGQQESDHQLFYYHNRWIERMPFDVQQTFFNLYKRADELFSSALSGDDLLVELRQLSTQIVDFVPLDQIYQFLYIEENVQTPSSVPRVFDAGPTGRNRREKTYTLAEYERLVCLTFAMRLMLPIWGELMERFKALVENEKIELIAFELISNSKLMASQPMIRLEDFISNTLPKEANISAALIGGIASMEYLNWVTALVILRRLVVGRLQDSKDGTSLISYIHSYIDQTAKNSKFGGYIKDKSSNLSTARDGDNELSTWETYRVKKRFIPGDVVHLEHYLNDPIRVYKHLMTGLPDELVEKHMPTEPGSEFEKLLEYSIDEGQRTLLQYVVSLVGTHRLLPEVSRVPLYHAMIAGVHFLDAIGQTEVAGLMTSIAYPSTAIGSVNIKPRKTDDNTEILSKIYPWPRRLLSRAAAVETKHAWQRSLDAIEPMFTKGYWWMTVNDDMLVRITGNTIDRVYMPQYSLKSVLINFFIAIEQRRLEINQVRKALRPDGY